MKRIVANFVSMIALGAICVMTACSSEASDMIVEEEDFSEVCHWQCADIHLQVNRTNFDARDGATRSVGEGWKDGDHIYLILKDKDGNDVQAYVTYDAAAASWNQVEFYGYKSYLTCTTPRKVEAYYFDGEMDVTTSDVTFDATTGIYMCKDGVYTYPADGDLEVSISLVPLTSRIRFTGEPEMGISILGGMKGYTGFSRETGTLTGTLVSADMVADKTGTTPYIYGVFADQELPTLIVGNNGYAFKTVFEASTNVLQVGHSGYIAMPTADSHRGWKQTVRVTGLSLDRYSFFVPKGGKTVLQASLTPTDATCDIVWSSSDTSIVQVSGDGVVTAVAVGSATITAIAYENTSVKATCSVDVVDANGYEYVDLGLSSGTLWATMNVGASSSSSYGDYFAWGEVVGSGINNGMTNIDTFHEIFDWESYKYCDGAINTMTKYCTDSRYGDVDNRTELELSDDAANHNWGGSWRIPSKTQIEELYNECIWEHTSGGYQVYSRKNENSIFIPETKSSGHAYYWSSSLNENSNYAYILNFYYDYVLPSEINVRCSGLCIRPVLCPE